MISIDMSELKKYRLSLSNAKVEDTIKDTLKEAVSLGLRRTKEKTPVLSGTLRRGWQITNIEKEGNNWVVTLFNDVKYAMYVEYGHRTRTNQKTGSRNGFVQGRYMMKISCEEVERDMAGIVDKHMKAFFRKMGYR